MMKIYCLLSMTAVQKMMAKSMNAALRIPHFGYADEVRIFEISEYPRLIRAQFELTLAIMACSIRSRWTNSITCASNSNHSLKPKGSSFRSCRSSSKSVLSFDTCHLTEGFADKV